jgi:3-oxoacyl-[acyl-carrier protein] reductase
MSAPTRPSRTALVTGVSRGLGLAVARRLLAEGWSICGVSREESPAWRDLAAAHPGRTEWRAVDLARPETVEPAVFGEWLPPQRPVHALVSNAAMAYDDLVSNLQLEPLQAMFAVNVYSPMALVRGVIRTMLLHGTAGSIVHVSSVTVRSGAKGLAMYAATKGAVEAFSKGTAREWGARGIRSNCVVPGYMETEMTASLSDEQRAKIHRRTALQRPTELDSVAATVAFLVSDDARSITGQSYGVDAGHG